MYSAAEYSYMNSSYIIQHICKLNLAQIMFTIHIMAIYSHNYFYTLALTYKIEDLNMHCAAAVVQPKVNPDGVDFRSENPGYNNYILEYL